MNPDQPTPTALSSAVIDDLDGWPARLAEMPYGRAIGRLGQLFVNGLGVALDGFGLRPFSLEPDAIVASARRITGLTHLGDLAHPEGFSIACRSLARDGRLGLFGRIVLRRALTESVCNRLRYVDARARVPQRFEVPLRRPIFVVGLPRSGTTMLHRLLCAVPGTRGVPLWESRQPIAPLPDVRRDRLAWTVAGIRAFAPEIMSRHSFELDAPEEAIALFDASFGWNPFLWRIGHCPTYVDWMLGVNPVDAYRVFVDLLRWIAAPMPDLHMVLKTPDHVGFVDILDDLVPGAVFVHTHRDPARCIPSYASLSESMHRLSTGSADPNQIGATSLRMWRTLIDRMMEIREVRPDLTLIDVDYDELMEEPAATVTRVCAEAGLDWTLRARAAVEAEVRARPPGRFGAHRYSAEHFGLSEEGIRETFAEYIERFLPHLTFRDEQFAAAESWVQGDRSMP